MSTRIDSLAELRRGHENLRNEISQDAGVRSERRRRTCARHVTPVSLSGLEGGELFQELCEQVGRGWSEAYVRIRLHDLFVSHDGRHVGLNNQKFLLSISGQTGPTGVGGRRDKKLYSSWVSGRGKVRAVGHSERTWGKNVTAASVLLRCHGYMYIRQLWRPGAQEHIVEDVKNRQNTQETSRSLRSSFLTLAVCSTTWKYVILDPDMSVTERLKTRWHLSFQTSDTEVVLHMKILWFVLQSCSFIQSRASVNPFQG